MRSVGSHSTSGREKEGIKERMGWAIDRFDSDGSMLNAYSSSFFLGNRLLTQFPGVAYRKGLCSFEASTIVRIIARRGKTSQYVKYQETPRECCQLI